MRLRVSLELLRVRGTLGMLKVLRAMLWVLGDLLPLCVETYLKGPLRVISRLENADVLGVWVAGWLVTNMYAHPNEDGPSQAGKLLLD